MSNHRVLVVDDSRLVREWTANILSRAGIEVVVRENGQECCNDVAEVMPDVIIMDLEMPVMGGMATIKKLRSNPQTRHIPVLVFTSKTTLDTKIEALDTGANDFLSKDSDEAELIARVNSLLRVTELEGQLISERNKLRHILNDLADPVVIVDMSGQLILVNDAGSAMLDIPMDRLGVLRIDDVVARLDDGDAVLDALKSERSDEFEVRMKSDDKVRTFRVVVTTVYQSQVMRLGKALLFHDVTRENEIKEMKATFMSMIAHDLRSPISVITGYTGLLISEKAGSLNETQREFLDGIQGRAKAMLKLVDEFLTVSQFESAFMKLNLKPTDVSVILDESIKALAVIASTKRITVKLRKRGRVPRAIGDADKLYKVFTNLLDNALKYTPDGGRVDVTVSRRSDAVQIEVGDSGIGIPKSEIEYVFDRYKRAASATRSKIKGTGLGLTIVSEIITAHGGKVWAESEEGEGSRFFVVLPAAIKAKEKTELAEIT